MTDKINETDKINDSEEEGIGDESPTDESTTLTTKTLDDEFERKKRYINPCNFDDATLRRRDIELRELQKLYPNMCVSWLELAWNFCEFTPKEEQDRIIREKEFEKPCESNRLTGGVIKNAISVESRSGEVAPQTTN